jgi:hypothetical protein
MTRAPQDPNRHNPHHPSSADREENMSTHTHRTFPAVVALAATFLFGGLAFGGPAFAAYPGANGKIAYETDDGIDSDIAVINANGTGQTNLTNDPSSNPFEDRDPSWSPDGTKIAWARVDEGHRNIFVMNADASGAVNLTPGPETTGQANSGIEPTWSPDGTKIAYNHSGEIWVMNASGSGKVKLDPIPAGLEQAPAWSPDGSKIAFTRNTDVWVRPASGGAATNLTNTSGGEKAPDWSPQGSKFVYERAGDVWSMNSDGTAQTNLTTDLGEVGGLPAWSPDGAKVVFDSNGFTAPNGDDIFVMNPDGTGVTRLTTDVPTNEFDPSWQPVAVPGGYPRPKGASPLRVSLVPAYRQCTAPNRTHGPPLAFGSCNPPALESSQLTVGSPDANGQPANSSGVALYTAIVGAPGGPDDSDLSFSLQLTDVRHQGTLADYTGELQARTVARITDRLGGPANEPATVTDAVFPVTVPCTATGGAEGATCAVTTTFDAVMPGAIPEGKRSMWQLDRVLVNDGGADGLVSTTPNTLFAVQGVFVP